MKTLIDFVKMMVKYGTITPEEGVSYLGRTQHRHFLFVVGGGGLNPEPQTQNHITEATVINTFVVNCVMWNMGIILHIFNLTIHSCSFNVNLDLSYFLNGLV